MLDTLKKKLNEINEYIAEKGIVLPFIRDNGVPSVSLTLLIVSFMIWAAGLLEIVKDMDMDKAENGVWAMAGLYFGRKVTKDKNNKVEIDSQQQNTQGDAGNAKQ